MSELEIDSQRASGAVTTAEPAPPVEAADEPQVRGRAPWGWLRAVAPILLGVLGVLFFYGLAGGVRHIRVPLGADSYFYVQALRITGKYGLGTTHLLARPAYPLIGSALAHAAHATPWAATVELTMAMTACLGLAGGALLARWRVRGWGLALAVFLTGASVTASRLLAGKSENLMNVWLLAAMLAVAVWGGKRRAWIGAMVLAFGAGLAEWPFLAAFLVILAIALVVWELAPWSPAAQERRALRGVATGFRERAAAWVRRPTDHLEIWMLVAATVVAAALVALVVGVWNGTGPGDAVELTPQPAEQYLIGLKTQLRFEWPLLTTLLFLAGWLAGRAFRNRQVEPVRWVLTIWAALVGVTIAVGLTGIALPAFRALTFDLPIGLGVAAAAFLPAAYAPRFADRWRRVALRACAALLAVLAVVPAFTMWVRDFRPPTNPWQLGEIRAASDYSLGIGGRRVILVVERGSPITTYFLQRAVVSATGGGGGERVLIFVGHAGDVLKGRPTEWGSAPYDSLAKTLFQPVLQAYRNGAPILAGATLDAPGFASAVSRHRPVVGESLAVLRGPPPRPKTASPATYFPLPHWWIQVGVALLFVVLLWLCGAGWARLAMPNAPAAVRAAIAPAFGAVALTMTTLVAAHAVHHLEGWAGIGALLAALAASAVAAVVGARDERAHPIATDA
jgi:hypothetical protein